MSRYQAIFMLLFISSALIIREYYYIPKFNRLKANYFLTTGYVYECTNGMPGKAPTPLVRYKYYIFGKEYVHSQHEFEIASNLLKSNFLYKSFPVAVSKEDFDFSIILITPNSFKEFEIIPPDSLAWVSKYLYKNEAH